MPMAEKPPKPSCPTLSLPPRSSFDSIFSSSFAGFSPGPMTLVSNFFSNNDNNNNSINSLSDCSSFSQLLAGAMTSPVASAPESREEEGREGERESGFRQNRPVSLVVTQPTAMAGQPPELSPFGFLSPSFFSPLQSPFGMSHQQALAQVTAQAAFSQSYMQMQQPEQQQPEQQPGQQPPYVDHLLHHQTHQEPITTIQQVDTVSVMSEPESFAIESPEVTQSERKVVPLSIADKPANDGYNWRKYGQKQVKASEYPRSYYKCTYQNCRVTKKVERNLEGKITEIIYKNQHNHDLPEPSRRSKSNIDTRPNVSSRASPDLGLPREIEVSRSIEVSRVSHDREQSLPQLMSVPQANTTNGLEIIEVEPRKIEDEDEPYPKRRNIEVEQSEKSSFAKTVTEPKIVLQTRSEVDLLDDGYKWRKYGQKVVKGNPHPRSYYKCTFNGCNVRKHVERSSTDPKAVITTYEGKHNHDVPAPKRSNSSAPEMKPQKPMVRKRTSNQEMEFNYDQRHLQLQLKEENIKA